MKPETRDNLLYLAVGLTVAAFVVADFIYADTHGRTMWVPSNLAFRAVATTGLVAYYVVREKRKMKATLAQVLACALFASVVQLAIVFGFRQTVDQLSGIAFSVLAVFEMFFVFQLAMLLGRYLR